MIASGDGGRAVGATESARHRGEVLRPDRVHRCPSGRPRWALVSLLVAAVATAGCGGSGGGRGRLEIDPALSLGEALDAGASLLWVGAHPDDEVLASPLLVDACRGRGNDCHLLVLTRGEGGTCFAGPCEPDLGTVRAEELLAAAEAYGASAEVRRFSNGASGGEEPEQVVARWAREGDPAATVADAIRAIRPNLVLSLDPSNGFTGHPEHRATGRLVREAVARAADPDDPSSARPAFAVDRLYHVLNRYPVLAVVGLDDGPVDERVPLHEPCTGSERSCFEVGLEAAGAHRSQWPFVLALSLAGNVVQEGLLRRIDVRGVDDPLGAQRRARRESSAKPIAR